MANSALEGHLKSPLGAPVYHLEGTSRAFWGHLEDTWRTLGIHLELIWRQFRAKLGVQGAFGVQLGCESADLENTSGGGRVGGPP